MTHRTTLTVTSVIAILLVSLHISDDIVRGFEPGGFRTAQGILMMSVWLYATIALAPGRLKYSLMLLGALLGVVVSLAHMRGAGIVGGRVAGSEGMLLWVYTIFILGLMSTVSAVMSARELWSVRSVSRHEVP